MVETKIAPIPSARLEARVGMILRAGVLAAAAVLLLGLALLGWRGDAVLEVHGDAVSAFARGPEVGGVAFARTPRAVLAAATRGEPGGVIQVGLLMLLLLPVVRVAATVVLFIAEREYLHAAIAASVLVLLSFGALD